jgi:hypothetical protein
MQFGILTAPFFDGSVAAVGGEAERLFVRAGNTRPLKASRKSVFFSASITGPLTSDR